MPMATDIQSLLSSLGAVKQSRADSRDRSASLSAGSSDNRFDSLVQTAHAHPFEPKPSPVAPSSRHAMRSGASFPSKPMSQADRSGSAHERVLQQKPAIGTERKHPEDVEQLDEVQDDENTEPLDKAAVSNDVPPDMRLAGFLPQPSTEGQHESVPTSSDDATQAANGTVDGMQPTTTMESPSLEIQSAQIAPRKSSSANLFQASGQTATEGAGAAESKSTGEETKLLATPAGESDQTEAVLLRNGQNENVSGDLPPSATDGPLIETHPEPDKTTPSPAVNTSHMMNKTDGVHESDLQTPFEAVVRASDVSVGHGTSSPEQFFSQDQPSSESRNGSSHTKSNLLPSGDLSLRPQFPDQATGVSPSAPPAVEGRASRGEAGPTVVHASERINDFPGGMASAQTVTLDLDPLDMGPLRVRIMMTEQTVHTHIRTEHGELGQGLLQQGSSLEASLRTTGLEMGTLRVTVDQQQGRGDHAWTFQQQQGRPNLLSGTPAKAGEDDRVPRAGQNMNNNGRVSWFA